MNKSIIGQSSCHSTSGQWCVPLDKKDKQKLRNIKLPGPKVGIFMVGFHHLVSVCANNCLSLYRNEWDDVCTKFAGVMGLLESKEEFSVEYVNNF